MSCDLHNHSTCSDGSVPIQRLPGIAARTGLHAIAISDHDTTLSAAYCYAHPRQEGVELIPAVELTGYDFERQHRVHLLCYYPNLDCVPLREHCEIMKQRRNACGLQTVHELEAMYPQFTEELVWETAAESGVIYKSGIMQVLGELGLSDGSIYGETYHKLFGWNPRGIVLHSPEYLPVREVFIDEFESGLPATHLAIGSFIVKTQHLSYTHKIHLQIHKIHFPGIHPAIFINDPIIPQVKTTDISGSIIRFSSILYTGISKKLYKITGHNKTLIPRPAHRLLHRISFSSTGITVQTAKTAPNDNQKPS